MHLDADDLLAVIRREYPDAYDRCALVLQNELLTEQVRTLEAQIAQLRQYGPPDVTAQFDLPEGGRHG